MRQPNFVSTLLFAALSLLTLPLGVQPRASNSPAQNAPALPSEVSALLPAGAISLHFDELPLGLHGSSMAVHIWIAARATTEHYGKWQLSPFCVDLFEPGDKPGSWKFVTSAVYLGQDPPKGVETHWLQPKKKQGPVLIIVSSNGAPGMSVRHTLIAFPNGIRSSYLDDSVAQDFWSGGQSGGYMEQRFDGVDARGYMTVTSEDSLYGKKISSKVHHWTARGFDDGLATRR